MTTDISTEPAVHEVDPARLESGHWCHRAEKTIGQGDISASYSADRIGMGKPVRKPFSWQGGLWVCVGKRHRPGELVAEAYRLVHPAVFGTEGVSYAQKTSDAEAARADPNGFYHGMAVSHRGALMVLCGPPVRFVPGQAEQGDLFGDLSND